MPPKKKSASAAAAEPTYADQVIAYRAVLLEELGPNRLAAARAALANGLTRGYSAQLDSKSSRASALRVQLACQLIQRSDRALRGRGAKRSYRDLGKDRPSRTELQQIAYAMPATQATAA